MKFFNTQQAIKLIKYASLYATLATLLTATLAILPTFLQIEYAIYDPLQRYHAFNQRSDLKDIDRKLYLMMDEIVCINIDTTFFNPSKVRVKRDKLAQLLDIIDKKSKPTSVFLDFIFAPADSHSKKKTAADKRLIQSLEQFKAPIVLPNNLTFDTLFFWEKLSIQDTVSLYPLLYEATHSGYLAPMVLVGDESYRYLQLKTDDDSLYSATYKLLEVSRKQNPESLIVNIPNRLEINYIINHPTQKKIPVLTTYDASALLEFDTKKLHQVLSNRIVFMGIFDHLTDDYGKSIDTFKTPLGAQTGGIYILLNAFLNVITHTYIQRVHWCWIWLLNFLIAGTGVGYYFKHQNQQVKSWKRLVGEIIGSLLFFLAFLWVLYSHWSLKFPFVITVIFYLRNQYFFQLFQKRFL